MAGQVMSGLIGDWLSQYPPRTAATYRSTLAEFERMAGLPAEDATQSHLLAYQTVQGGLSVRTIGRKLHTLSSFYKYLQRRQVRADSPMAAIRLERYKVDPAASIQYLSLEEVRVLMAAATEPRTRALIALGLHGLRVSELVSMDVDHLQDGVLVGIIGKGGRSRSVPLHPEALAIVREYIGDRRSGPLFLTRSRRRLSVRMAQDVIYEVSTRAGKRIHAHQLRHTAATILLRSGADLSRVQDTLGHRSADTSRVYARLTVEDLKDSINAAPMLGNEAGVSSHPQGRPPAPRTSYGLTLLQGGRDETGAAALLRKEGDHVR